MDKLVWQADGVAKFATKYLEVCANADPREGQTSDRPARGGWKRCNVMMMSLPVPRPGCSDCALIRYIHWPKELARSVVTTCGGLLELLGLPSHRQCVPAGCSRCVLSSHLPRSPQLGTFHVQGN